ncbi:MAG: protein phosphatase 2C domain-containing protein, partial [Pseudomonadota bacterium]
AFLIKLCKLVKGNSVVVSGFLDKCFHLRDITSLLGCIKRADIGLWAVADGMGGHAAGDLASGKIVEQLQQIPDHEKLSALVADVENRLTSVNDELRDIAAQQNMSTVGSTVAALVIRGRFGMCLWVGDSRVYRVRTGGIEQLTQDHAFVEDLVEKGILSREAAANHPQSNLVTRAVGAQDGLKLDLEIFELHDNDIFVLCSDGLDKEVSEDEIAELAAKEESDRLSDELVELALRRGARDNVTVVTVTVKDGTATDFGSLKPPPRRAPEPRPIDTEMEGSDELPEGARTDFRRLAREDDNGRSAKLLDDEEVTIRRTDLDDG